MNQLIVSTTFNTALFPIGAAVHVAGTGPLDVHALIVDCTPNKLDILHIVGKAAIFPADLQSGKYTIRRLD